MKFFHETNGENYLFLAPSSSLRQQCQLEERGSDEVEQKFALSRILNRKDFIKRRPGPGGEIFCEI